MEDPKERARSGPGQESLFVECYADLRRLAASRLRSESAMTLEPTALVHEVYLRLGPERRSAWKNQAQFMAVAAKMMRNVVIDQARRVHAERRGEGWKRVDLDPSLPVIVDSPEDALWLGEILDQLARNDERQAQILECRIFGGMTVPEVADALGVSVRTIEADWTMIRAWLRKQLSDREKKPGPGD